MKQKTNGKIVIAILAMFAIAASVIGFTYAYFTANLTRNTQDSSAQVIAGKLMATFEGTNSIDVTNVVPGWKSDALHYYNAASITDGTIETIEIPSSAVNDTVNGGLYSPYSTDFLALHSDMGQTAPISFEVENTSENSDPDDAVYYYIKLNITNNNIRKSTSDCTTLISANAANGTTATQDSCENDYKNFLVSIYTGEMEYVGLSSEEIAANKTIATKSYEEIYDSAALADKTNARLAGKFYVGASGEQQIIVTAPESLLKGKSQKYFVMFEYLNDESHEQLTKNSAVNLSVEIVGLQKVGSDYVDEDNNVITFPTVSSGKLMLNSVEVGVDHVGS